jgi:hypothetical protein
LSWCFPLPLLSWCFLLPHKFLCGTVPLMYSCSCLSCRLKNQSDMSCSQIASLNSFFFFFFKFLCFVCCLFLSNDLFNVGFIQNHPLSNNYFLVQSLHLCTLEFSFFKLWGQNHSKLSLREKSNSCWNSTLWLQELRYWQNFI